MVHSPERILFAPNSLWRIAQNKPFQPKQARDSEPQHSTKDFSTMFIWIDTRHENGLSPFQPIRGENRPEQARTETGPKKRAV